jgi:hypothetical protein
MEDGSLPKRLASVCAGIKTLQWNVRPYEPLPSAILKPGRIKSAPASLSPVQCQPVTKGNGTSFENMAWSVTIKQNYIQEKMKKIWVMYKTLVMRCFSNWLFLLINIWQGNIFYEAVIHPGKARVTTDSVWLMVLMAKIFIRMEWNIDGTK